MKYIVLTTVFILMCFFLGAQGTCNYKGNKLTEGSHIIGCAKYTCHKDGHVSGIACPVFACQEEIGYQEEDLSKPYPSCCERPICKEES